MVITAQFMRQECHWNNTISDDECNWLGPENFFVLSSFVIFFCQPTMGKILNCLLGLCATQNDKQFKLYLLFERQVRRVFSLHCTFFLYSFLIRNHDNTRNLLAKRARARKTEREKDRGNIAVEFHITLSCCQRARSCVLFMMKREMKIPSRQIKEEKRVVCCTSTHYN